MDKLIETGGIKMVKFWTGLVIGAIIGVTGTVLLMKATNDRAFDDEHEEELAAHVEAMNRDKARSGGGGRSRQDERYIPAEALSGDTSNEVALFNEDEEDLLFDPDVLTPMPPVTKAGMYEYEGARTFIITRQEFDAPFEEFEKLEVDYDITNDLLFDEAGDPVPVDVLASKPIIDRFYDANGCNTVYVRNMGLDLDYQITKVDGHGNMVSFRPRTSEEEYEAIEEAEAHAVEVDEEGGK